MAWARVAGSSASAVSGVNPISLAVTTGGVQTVNNRLILVIEYNGTNVPLPVSSVTDNRGNVWNKDVPSQDHANAGITGRGEVWSANIGTGGVTTTVTVTLSSALTGGDGISMAIEEYSGLDTTTMPVDVWMSSHGTGTTPSSGATGPTTAANELVIGAWGDDGEGQSFAAGAGFTKRASIELSGVSECAIEEKDSGALGTTQTATGTGNAQWTMLCVVYKLFSTPPPPPVYNPDLILWQTEATPWDIRLRDPSETGGGGPTPIVGTDSGVLTEAIASLIVLVATGETVAASEAASVLVLASAADSVAATEAAAIQVIVAGAETLGATDAVAGLISLVTGADTATATESAALIVSVAQNDPLAATDAVASLLVLLAAGDAASLSESNSILALLSGADAVTATEGATVTILVLVTGSDTVAATEAAQLQASLSAADTVGAADGTAAGLATLLADDPVTAAELAELLVALAADDAATATEDQSVDTGAPPVTVTDGETLTATEGAQIFAFAPSQDSGWSQTRHIRVVSEVRTGAGELLQARENAWVDVVWQLVVGVDQLHATESASLRKSQSQEQSITAITLLMDTFEDE